MHQTLHTAALVAFLTLSSSVALASPLQPVPQCAVSHNDNGKLCLLAVVDGSFSTLDGWHVRAGEPEIRTAEGGSYLRMAQPGVGISQLIGLPVGSTVDAGHVPAYWVDLHLRTSYLTVASELDGRGPAMALVRLSLTDADGGNAVVLGERTVEAGTDGWKQINLSIDAEPYAFNSFLKVEIIRNDGEDSLALDLDAVSVTQVTL